MTKNFARRKVARTNALFQVRNAATTAEGYAKRTLSRTEYLEFVLYIRQNQNGKFGIEKLKDLDLNSVIQEEGFHDEKTLVEYAVLFKRDAILSLLLRAGASPLSPYILESAKGTYRELIAQVITFLWSVNSYFSPYVVKLALSSRLSTAECTLCSSTSTFKAIELYPCKHIVCDICFWKNAVTTRCSQQVDIQCPLPDCRCLLAVDQLDLSLYPVVSNEEEAAFHYSPDMIRMKSKAKFDMLPEKFDPKAPLLHKKKMPFMALPMRAINRLNLGESKMGRLENMFKAFEKSNPARVKALISVGVDIDAVNEYGQTGLFIACWKKDLEMQKLLVDAGANEIPDNAGYWPRNFSKNEKDVEEAFRFLSTSVDDSSPSVKQLVNLYKYPDHPGAQDGGSFLLEGFISESFLNRLDDLLSRLPLAVNERKRKETGDCAERLYYCDSFGVVQSYLASVVSKAGLGKASFFPQMRFLKYGKSGFVPPHVDLARTSPEGIRSTHTFILYTHSCGEGGATVLLDHIPTSSKPDHVEIARINPVRSALLLFPHMTPHLGLPAGDAKVLLRGEMLFLI